MDDSLAADSDYSSDLSVITDEELIGEQNNDIMDEDPDDDSITAVEENEPGDFNIFMNNIDNTDNIDFVSYDWRENQ